MWWFRLVGSFGTGILTLIALFLGDVDTLGKSLGVCVVAMAVLFGICAATVAVSPAEFGRGLVVPIIPAGSSITVLSLVSTTAVPFNVFLVRNRSFFAMRVHTKMPNICQDRLWTNIGKVEKRRRLLQAASMCTKTASLGSMQRGIGFAAVMTATISILIVIVGSAITVPPDRGANTHGTARGTHATLGSTHTRHVALI